MSLMHPPAQSRTCFKTSSGYWPVQYRKAPRTELLFSVRMCWDQYPALGKFSLLSFTVLCIMSLPSSACGAQLWETWLHLVCSNPLGRGKSAVTISVSLLFLFFFRPNQINSLSLSRFNKLMLGLYYSISKHTCAHMYTGVIQKPAKFSDLLL